MLLLVVAVVFLTAGWTLGQRVDGREAPARADAPQPTSTTTDPGPTPDDPLHVVLAGDSVMAGLTPALLAGFERSGVVDARFVLTPSVLRDATVRFTWQRAVQEFEPDVVVMFVGTWELAEIGQGGGVSLLPDDDGWLDAYENQVLDPWIDFLASAGAEVVWIGAPAVDNEEVNASFAELNSAFAAAAGRWDEVVFVDAGTVLGRPEDGYPGGDLAFLGQVVRARQVDGLHLCPDGAALLAAEVLSVVGERWQVPTPDGWQDGPWRSDPAFPEPSCPQPVG
jgi:hypothetical protein